MSKCLKCGNWVEAGYDICDNCRIPVETKEPVKNTVGGTVIRTESKPKAKKTKK